MFPSRLCCLTVVVVLLYASVAMAQTTNPFEALEGARRDRIEQKKRAAQDAVEQRRIEKKKRASEETAEKSADSARASANPAASKTKDTTAREIKR